MVQITAMTEAAARSISLWRYEPPYNFYDGSQGEVSMMLNPANSYFVVRAEGELVGYVCFGPDARVAGQHPEPGIDDVGWGFRPDLTGRGIASRWLPRVLELLSDFLPGQTQRVVVAAWNERSRATARRLGFSDSDTFSNAVGTWVVLTRSRPWLDD